MYWGDYMIGLAFFVYKRPDLTKQVIESIKRNKFEKIYIFQDGLKNEKDREAWEEVSLLVKAIDFADTEIHISQNNKGLSKSIIEGMSYVFQFHNTAIALEDDVVLADGYKHIMEKMFQTYSDNKKVMGISGGSCGGILLENYSFDIYFCYRMMSIAFGTWKDRWQGFKCDPMLLKSIKKDARKNEILSKAGTDLEKMFLASIKGEIDTWATYWSLYQIDQLGVHAIPVQEYAIDIGRKGEGTNTTVETVRYETELNGEIKDDYNFPTEVIVQDSVSESIMDLLNVSKDKFIKYFDILCIWMELYRNERSTLEYFKDYNIKEIYIYGAGKLANFLWEDVRGEIDVVSYIVENKYIETYNEREVVGIKQAKNLKEVPIVVTPSYDISLIRFLFRKLGIKNKVILIDEIVEYVRKKQK